MGDVDSLLEMKRGCDLTDKCVIGGLFQAVDEGKDFVSGSDNYVWFYLIGKLFRPRVISEMGSRFGYSMKCFVDGSGRGADEFTIRSFDAECDGIETLGVFESYFKTEMGIKDIAITRADTQSLSTLDMDGRCDLSMVDGMHTVEGCLHECNLAWQSLKPGGIMVVDDTKYPVPKEGLDAFCSQRNQTYSYVPSLRGISLVVKA